MNDVERLLAIEEIKQLKSRYFRCVDTKDWEGYRAVFADDVRFDVSQDMPEGGLVTGVEAATAIARQFLSADVVSVHHGHCPEIEITSATTARGIWAMEDMLRWGPASEYPGQTLHGMGHYAETYEKTAHGWRIKTLKLTRLVCDLRQGLPHERHEASRLGSAKERGTAHDTIIWISGATQGLGAGLAATVPFENVRVINLSLYLHPTLESLQFDLTDPSTWQAVGEHFRKTLRDFTGKRVIFIHNAIVHGLGYATEVDRAAYQKEFTANGLAPLILGDMFLSAVGEGYESGLVMITSAGARSPFEGHSAYCAAKAAVEMWVRTVRRELKRRGKKTWVVGIRPGFVDTPSTRAEAQLPAEVYPLGPQMAKQLASREAVMTPEEAARGIWAMLPPSGDESILQQGEMVVVS